MKLWSCSLCCVCLLLLSAPWKTVKPMSDVSRCKVCGCPDGPDYGDPHECPPGFKVSPPPPTVPRVARSVDDLRVGQWVAVGTGGYWSAWKVIEGRSEPGQSEGPLSTTRILLGSNPVVILSDPPARDWLVPATQMEALRSEVEAWEGSGRAYDALSINAVAAARAVLDAAREVEHE